jgi:uncharacterized protein
MHSILKESVDDLGSGRSRRTIPITTLASGLELALTVHVIRGKVDGPVVGVSAMIHGDEFDGLLIAKELWDVLDPSQLQGEVHIVGVANPLAMDGLSHRSPIDMLDMNGVFPGASSGSVSEQQAYALAHGVIDRLDFLVDLHCGGTFPWVDFCHVANDEGLSRAFLAQLLYAGDDGRNGSPASYAAQRGVRCTVVEIGGGFHEQAAHIGNGTMGLMNQLRYAGVLAGEVVKRPGQRIITDARTLRPSVGGICIPRGRLTPGEEIAGGTPIADIVNPSSFETLETLEAPFERSVVMLTRNFRTRIHPGDCAYMLGDGTSAVMVGD